MKHSVTLRVNGREHRLELEARTTLLEVVREYLGLTGAKAGCDLQVCGACTVLLNGKPASACSALAVDADGAEVLTIEGLGDGAALHPLQEAFMECGALQCGYCTPGFILAAKFLLEVCPHPTEEEMRRYLGGNLCRCGCYMEIREAVKKAAGL